MFQLYVPHHVFAFSFLSPPLSTSSFAFSLASANPLSYVLEVAWAFSWLCLISLVIVKLPASVFALFMVS